MPIKSSKFAKTMAGKRWENVPAEERSRLMREAGALGGRKRSPRCECGKYTAYVAGKRNHACAKIIAA